jgi:hypothetical protein
LENVRAEPSTTPIFDVFTGAHIIVPVGLRQPPINVGPFVGIFEYEEETELYTIILDAVLLEGNPTMFPFGASTHDRIGEVPVVTFVTAKVVELYIIEFGPIFAVMKTVPFGRRVPPARVPEGTPLDTMFE